MAKHSSWPGAAWRLAVFRRIRRTTKVPGAIARADKPRKLCPNLGIKEVLAGIEVAGIGAGRQVLPATIGDDQHNLRRLACCDGLRGLRQGSVHDCP
jgi:hypothetical protein